MKKGKMCKEKYDSKVQKEPIKKVKSKDKRNSRKSKLSLRLQRKLTGKSKVNISERCSGKALMGRIVGRQCLSLKKIGYYASTVEENMLRRVPRDILSSVRRRQPKTR